MRGKGIATELVEFACEWTQYRDCYIDVLSKNTVAMSLYEKQGFEIYKKSFNLFTMMQGFGHPVLMKKHIR